MIDKKMIKRITPLMAAALTAALLCGCGTKKEDVPVTSEVAGSAIVQTESQGNSKAADSEAAKNGNAEAADQNTADQANAEGADSGAADQASSSSLSSAASATAAVSGEESHTSDVNGSAIVEISLAEEAESFAEETVDAASEDSGFAFSLGGTINSIENGAFPDAESGTSDVAGSAIVPGIGGIVIKPLEKNELSQYIGLSFAELEKKFPGMESETSVGVRSYKLGEGSGDRTHQVGMTGSESGGVITKINIYAGETYKIAGITAGMDLTAADKAARDAGFDPEGESASGLITYKAPDGMTVRVYSSDGATVNTVTCET